MVCWKERDHPSTGSLMYTGSVVFIALCLVSSLGHARPIEDSIYKDTEEIMNEWDNDNYYNSLESLESEEPSFAKISYLPPVLVEFEPVSTTSTTTTTTTTQAPVPVYFPKTEIELGPLFEQVSKAGRKEVKGPVELPVPYIVWKKDTSGNGNDNQFNYWQRFYNTMYKVD